MNKWNFRFRYWPCPGDRGYPRDHGARTILRQHPVFRPDNINTRSTQTTQRPISSPSKRLMHIRHLQPRYPLLEGNKKFSIAAFQIFVVDTEAPPKWSRTSKPAVKRCRHSSRLLRFKVAECFNGTGTYADNGWWRCGSLLRQIYYLAVKGTQIFMTGVLWCGTQKLEFGARVKCQDMILVYGARI